MSKIVCNIPHSSIYIPEWSLEDYIVDIQEINRFNEFMVDKDVDKLFEFVPDTNKVISKISRIVVDMERFRDDNQESMYKKGMGLFYTKNEVGKIIRNEGKTKELCLKLYDEYHSELEYKIDQVLNNKGYSFILDCHSFHNDFKYTGYSTKDFPDICLGFNNDYSCPPKLRNQIKQIFEKMGYSVKFNVPFSGTLIPLKFSGDRRIQGLMIEINRRVYINDMLKFSNLCQDIYNLINNFEW